MASAIRDEKPLVQVAERRSPQILVVEDDHELRDLLEGALIEAKLNVVSAMDGVEALEILNEYPGIGLVVSDVLMPRMDGYEFVGHALKLRPELKVVMITAYAAEMPPPALLKAREIRTLSKPANLDEVCEVVRAMLSRS